MYGSHFVNDAIVKVTMSSASSEFVVFVNTNSNSLSHATCYALGHVRCHVLTRLVLTSLTKPQQCYNAFFGSFSTVLKQRVILNRLGI